MRSTLRTLAVGAALALTGAAADAASAPHDVDIRAALKTIQRDADAIAAGKYHGASLQAPAHEIGVQWYRVEPILAKNGAVLVETRMANASITTFDKTWRANGKAREAAKDVSSSVGDLLAAEQRSESAAPAASGAASAGPSGEPSGAPESPAPSGSPK